MMYETSREPPSRQTQPKMRTACDICHHSKVRCFGGNPCEGCQKSGARCKYSQSNRVGRPKGVRNKRTLENDEARIKSRPNSRPCSRPSSRHGSEKPSSSRKNTYSNHERNVPEAGNVLTFLPTPTSSVASSDNPLYMNDYDDFHSIFEPLSPEQSPLGAGQPFSLESPFLHGLNGGSFGSTYGPPGPILSPTESHDLMVLDGNRNIFKNEYESPTPTEYSGSRRVSPAPPARSAPHCECLRHSADLLCQLKTINQGNHSASIDIILRSASQSQQCLKRLLGCHNCQQNGDQEVLSLAVMSLRIVLRGLEGLCSNGGDNQYRTSGTSSPANQQLMAEALNGIELRLGIYEITGDQRITMTNMLVSRTVKKLDELLYELKRRLDFLKQQRDQLRYGPSSANSTPPGSSSNLMSLHSRSTPSMSPIDDDMDDVKPFVTPRDFDGLQEMFQMIEKSLSAL